LSRFDRDHVPRGESVAMLDGSRVRERGGAKSKQMSMASARPLTSSSTAAGYRALLAWMRGFGRLRAVGVEGAGSYGAALARHLAAKGGEGDRGRPS
jgi:hypothetical protein